MSHPNPSHDRESEYPSDNHKPVRKGFKMSGKTKALKKKAGSVEAPLQKLKRLIGESQNIRKGKLN